MADGFKEAVLPLKEQYEIMDCFLKHRLEDILPMLMKQEGIDMWIVAAREYNEDPVFLTMIPPLERTASRFSYLVFCLGRDGEAECLSVCRPSRVLESFYKRVWDKTVETQLQCISRLVKEKNPRSIAVNTSSSFALADGLSKTIYEDIYQALDEEFRCRLLSAEKLCVGWLETRSRVELDRYPSVYAVALDVIAEAFSNRVITAGVTTTGHVEWWIMQRINDLGLQAWFTPTVDLQREGVQDSRVFDVVIMPGDILHCDVGLRYLGLCTDTQRVAYVLKPGEADVPLGLKAALRTCNEFQDIAADNFRAGRSGNEILAAALEEAQKRSIKAMLYSHPIGCHGHGAGPLIGLWENQQSVPVRGDYTLKENTCYALELNTASRIPEWSNQEVTVFLEETVAYTDGCCRYLKDRQTEFITIRG